ncbi:hypothetical protein AGMMS50239_26100 [Bacteroidia bacterium]|nr:hypothetical protein AGMMS50239_26100 [Bacteroidia bacterium]
MSKKKTNYKKIPKADFGITAMIISAAVAAASTAAQAKQAADARKRSANQAGAANSLAMGQQQMDMFGQDNSLFNKGLNQATGVLQQDYAKNKPMDVPSFKYGSPPIDFSAIAVSKNEGLRMYDKVEKANVPGGEHSDSGVVNSGNILSVHSNTTNPITGMDFSDDSLSFQKYFGGETKDRDWLSKKTFNKRNSTKNQLLDLSEQVQAVQNYGKQGQMKTVNANTKVAKAAYGGVNGFDYASMGSSLSSLIPAAYNLWQGSRKDPLVTSQRVQRTHNPLAGTAMAMMNSRQFDVEPYLAKTRQLNANVRYNASDVGNRGAYRAIINAGDNASRSSLRDIYSAKNQQEGQWRAESAQMAAQLGGQYAQIENQANMYDMENRKRAEEINFAKQASRQAMTAAGWQGVGQFGNMAANNFARMAENKRMEPYMNAYIESVLGKEATPGGVQNLNSQFKKMTPEQFKGSLSAFQNKLGKNPSRVSTPGVNTPSKWKELYDRELGIFNNNMQAWTPWKPKY